MDRWGSGEPDNDDCGMYALCIRQGGGGLYSFQDVWRQRIWFRFAERHQLAS